MSDIDREQAPLIRGRTYKVNEEGDLEPTPDPSPALASIRRSFRFLVAATVAVYLVLGGVAFYAYTGTTAVSDGVCNLRSDLERRIKLSEEFVQEHPEAVRKLGYSKSQVEKEINNQKRTLKALSAVNCD